MVRHHDQPRATLSAPWYESSSRHSTKSNRICSNPISSRLIPHLTLRLTQSPSGIVGISQLLSDTHLSDNQREYLQIIGNSAASLEVLLNSILDISKFSTNNIELVRSKQRAATTYWHSHSLPRRRSTSFVFGILSKRRLIVYRWSPPPKDLNSCTRLILA